jgi:hypothetical protein
MAGGPNRRGVNAESVKETESTLPGLENKDVVITGRLISWMREEEREAPQTNTFSTRAPASSGGQNLKTFLHTVFSVKNYAQFAFVVPPNTASPQLRGTFRSFTKSDNSTTHEPADIGVMILNEQGFNDFVHCREGTATFELDSSHNQLLNYAFPPTPDEHKSITWYFAVLREQQTSYSSKPTLPCPMSSAGWTIY